MPHAPKTHQRKIRESTLGALAQRQAVERDAERRGTSRERGYSANWAKISKGFRMQNPLCVECGEPAECVDHIVPKRKGGTDHHSNLQAMCWACHSRKTAKEDGGFGRRTPKAGGDGASAGGQKHVPYGHRCARIRENPGGSA